MLAFYREIRLLDDTEISLGFLWGKMYAILHERLTALQNKEGKTPVGVAFPDYGEKKFPLGNRLRLFAPDTEILEKLSPECFFESMADYVEVSHILQTPAEHGYAMFARKQFKKTNPERLARRYAKRHGVSLEEAMRKYEALEEESEKIVEENRLPYINLQSTSTRQRYRLFIRKLEANEPGSGWFNTFGLGSDAAVPDF
jgi:CRISPR-associated endonuclease Csy4